MRRAAKVDTTHGEIRDFLRQAGWWVHESTAIGGGFPDLIVGYPGVPGAFFLECKSGTQDRAENRLSEAQREFRAKCPCTYIVATSGKEAEKQLRLAMLSQWKFR